MYARDHAAQALGIAVEAIEPGVAVLPHDGARGHGAGPRHLSRRHRLHACRHAPSPTPATPTIGSPSPSARRSAFVAPARSGEVLIATARERSRAGRTGVYDVEVSNGDGTLVALFRGTSYETRGEVVALAADRTSVLAAKPRGRRA